MNPKRRKRIIAREKLRNKLYDKYMREKLALPDCVWEPVSEDQPRTIGLYRFQYDYNQQQVQSLTSLRGVRFRLLN